MEKLGILEGAKQAVDMAAPSYLPGGPPYIACRLSQSLTLIYKNSPVLENVLTHVSKDMVPSCCLGNKI